MLHDCVGRSIAIRLSDLGVLQDHLRLRVGVLAPDRLLLGQQAGARGDPLLHDRRPRLLVLVHVAVAVAQTSTGLSRSSTGPMRSAKLPL